MMNQYRLLTIVAIALIAGVSDAIPPQAIVGGQRAAVGEFPYQVLLNKNGRHSCGGAIIGNRHVITAKHCVDSFTHPYTGLKVVTGTIELYLGQTHTVKSLHYYDRSTDSSEVHDIAIIELNNAIQFGVNQKAVALATNFIKVDATAIVTGWGWLSLSSPQSSHYLMKLTVKITKPHNPYSSLIYAIGGHQTGTCHRDSGGPLVRNNELVGIVHGGTPCATGVPDKYTNIYFYTNWIRRVMEKK